MVSVFIEIAYIQLINKKYTYIFIRFWFCLCYFILVEIHVFGGVMWLQSFHRLGSLKEYMFNLWFWSTFMSRLGKCYAEILNMFFSVSFQVLGCLFYAYYIFVRLCIPQFRSISMQLFDLRAMVLCVFNSILPGRMSTGQALFNLTYLDTFKLIRCLDTEDNFVVLYP